MKKKTTETTGGDSYIGYIYPNIKRERAKLKKYLRRQMKKVPDDADIEKDKKPFAFCYAQARFDILMEIDMELELGAFYKNRKVRVKKACLE